MSNRRSWRRSRQQRVTEKPRKLVPVTRSKIAMRAQLPVQRKAKATLAAYDWSPTAWANSAKYRKAEGRKWPRWRLPNWKQRARKLRAWQQKVFGLKGVTIPPSDQFPNGHILR